MKKSLALFALSIAVVSISAFADTSGRGLHIGWKVRQPTRFMVSGVLQKAGTTEIKLVHEIDVAGSSEAAVAALTKNASAQYKGYALISVLASPVPAVGACENSI